METDGRMLVPDLMNADDFDSKKHHIFKKGALCNGKIRHQADKIRWIRF